MMDLASVSNWLSATGAVAGEPHARFTVGAWQVDTALYQLSAAGRVVKIEPKVMAALVTLAARPGQVITREALLAAVWPGLVVGDDSLTQVIIKLRKALGDDTKEPTYIQTIAKGGYRLIAPVQPHTASPAAVTQAAAGPRSAWPMGHRRLRLLAVGVLAIVLLALAFWWQRTAVPGGGATPEMGELLSRAEQPTIMISVFDILGDDPQAALLARGIVADLKTDLSKVSGLAVITTGAATGDSAPAARYRVSGTVQTAAGQLRLHVALVDTRSGRQLWAERFDRAPKDLFAIQQELAPKILQVLPAKVSESELRRVAERYTRNLQAYEYFQRGQAALLVRQQEDNERAREMFRRAIEMDPSFARAYASLALTYAADYRNQWTSDGRAALERAGWMARTAYDMNPDMPETLWVLAFVQLEHRQHVQALRHLENAVRLSPSYADAYALMGGIHTYIGKSEDTVAYLHRALRFNPDGGYLYYLLLGRAYYFMGDLDPARVNLEQALSRNLENLESHVYMAALHMAAGDRDAASWEAEEIRVLAPGFRVRQWLDTYPMTDGAAKTRLMQALQPLGF